MGQFSVEKPVLPGSTLSGNQHRARSVLLEVNHLDKDLRVQARYFNEDRLSRRPPERLHRLIAKLLVNTLA
jgi:hypothetical protein